MHDFLIAFVFQLASMIIHRLAQIFIKLSCIELALKTNKNDLVGYNKMHKLSKSN